MGYMYANQIVPRNSAIVTLPVNNDDYPRRVVYTRVYANPIGICTKDVNTGTLLYRCVDKDGYVMVLDGMIFDADCKIMDDMDSLDGKEFSFDEDGNYVLCDFRVPKEIRCRNTYIKDLDVIQWETDVHWEDAWLGNVTPCTYQWDPKSHRVRDLIDNRWTDWSSNWKFAGGYRVEFLENSTDELSFETLKIADDELPF